MHIRTHMHMHTHTHTHTHRRGLFLERGEQRAQELGRRQAERARGQGPVAGGGGWAVGLVGSRGPGARGQGPGLVGSRWRVDAQEDAGDLQLAVEL